MSTAAEVVLLPDPDAVLALFKRYDSEIVG
jgi:hypothetical protein